MDEEEQSYSARIWAKNKKVGKMKTKFSPQFKITRSILNQLMEIEQARGFLKAAHLSKQWTNFMTKLATKLMTRRFINA